MQIILCISTKGERQQCTFPWQQRIREKEAFHDSSLDNPSFSTMTQSSRSLHPRAPRAPHVYLTQARHRGGGREDFWQAVKFYSVLRD